MIKLYDRKGVVVKWREEGETGFGSYFEVYELRRGKVLHTWYGDHTCTLDVFNQAIPETEVPPNVRKILGHRVQVVRKQRADYRVESLGF